MSQSSPYSPSSPPLSAADERLWSSLAHFGTIIGFLPSLLILLILGPRSAGVKQESRTALNFAITAAIGFAALYILGVVLGVLYSSAPSGVDVVFGLLGFLVGLAQFALWVVVVVFSIINGVRVNRGGASRYPFSLHLVK